MARRGNYGFEKRQKEIKKKKKRQEKLERKQSKKENASPESSETTPDVSAGQQGTNGRESIKDAQDKEEAHR